MGFPNIGDTFLEIPIFWGQSGVPSFITLPQHGPPSELVSS